MFVSFEDIETTEILERLDKLIGKYQRLTGKIPDVIEISIGDFERLKLDLVDLNGGREYDELFLKGSGIPIKIH